MIKTNVGRKSIPLHWLNFKMCEYKKRLLTGAVVVLQALLLLMPVSAFAAVEDAQEIGVPQAMDAPVKECFGGVLLPNADRFYTVRDGLLTQYQIKPFKKIDSISIDWEPIKAIGKAIGSWSSWCGILMSDDNSKLIIYSAQKVFLLDARTGQVLNWFERPQNTSISSAVLNEAELVLLETAYSGVSSRVRGGWDGYDYRLTIWDLSTLKLKTETPYLGELAGFFKEQGSRGVMLKTLDRIYLMNAISAAVLSSKTYAPELSIVFEWDSRASISREFDKLYVEKVSKVNDYLTDKQTTYKVKEDEVLVFNQKTRKSTFTNKKDISNEVYHSSIAGGLNASRNKAYLMFGFGSISIGNVTTREIYRFSQHESGEAILLEQKSKYFQLTPGARKYLMMKNSAGKIVPINDATFAKYHRTEGTQ